MTIIISTYCAETISSTVDHLRLVDIVASSWGKRWEVDLGWASIQTRVFCILDANLCHHSTFENLLVFQ